MMQILYIKIVTRVLAHNNTTGGGESPDNFLLTQMPFFAAVQILIRNQCSPKSKTPRIFLPWCFAVRAAYSVVTILPLILHTYGDYIFLDENIPHYLEIDCEKGCGIMNVEFECVQGSDGADVSVIAGRSPQAFRKNTDFGFDVRTDTFKNLDTVK